MQIMPSVWQASCPGRLTHPAINIPCGAQVFAHYLDQCDGNLYCALNLYWGSTKYFAESSPYTDALEAVE